VYFLDSDTFRLFRDGNTKVLANIAQTPYADIYLSGITVEEVVNGWFSEINDIRSGKSKVSLDFAYDSFLQAVKDVSGFQLRPYSQAAEQRFRELKKVAKNVRAMDIRLAAHAITAGATVVTRNAIDFGRIPGVRFVDWSV
jgi:tRNA(fMet)-specific endonuclease VapC